MFSLEAGVLVITMDISQFIHEMNHSMTFHISYTIKNEFEDSKLVVNSGHTFLSSETIYGNHLDITKWTKEIYKNLLAITSVSDFLRLNIDIPGEYEEVLNFLIDELKFDLLSDSIERGSEDFLFTQAPLRYHFILYCSSGYFNGVLIRFSTLTHRKLMNAKIYVR